MKETYDRKPADIDASQLSEITKTMFEQTETIRQEHPVTAENMTNIVVNYPVQTGLDEKAQKLLKKLYLQMFKGAK